MTPALFDLGDTSPAPAPLRTRPKVTRPKTVDAALHGARSRAAEVVAGLTDGECRHYVSLAEWSTHDLMAELLEMTGPAHLHFATWSMSEDALRQIVGWLDSGKLLSTVALLDWRIKVRRPEAWQLAHHALGTVRAVQCHAKMFVLTGGAFDVAVVGSANLTANPRVEAGVIHADRTIAAFHVDWLTQAAEGGTPWDEAKGGAGPAEPGE